MYKQPDAAAFVKIKTLEPGTTFRLPLITGELVGTLISLNPVCAEVYWHGARIYPNKEHRVFSLVDDPLCGRDTVSLATEVILAPEIEAPKTVHSIIEATIDLTQEEGKEEPK